MKIAIACDHGGFALKQHMVKYLTCKGYNIADFGTDSAESVDYPIFAKKVTGAVTSGECKLGILICGTGIGMSIAANKVRGIRAALCGDVFSAEMTRKHNDANVLCLGARVIDSKLAEKITDEFLAAEFEGGRHKTRVDMYE